MDKISSAQFHELMQGIVSAQECIGYGKQQQEAFAFGWASAMDRVYSRLVDTLLDVEIDA